MTTFELDRVKAEMKKNGDAPRVAAAFINEHYRIVLKHEPTVRLILRHELGLSRWQTAKALDLIYDRGHWKFPIAVVLFIAVVGYSLEYLEYIGKLPL